MADSGTSSIECLQDIDVWLTRPAEQVISLIPALQSLGARVTHIPMFEISPLSVEEVDKQKVLDLDHYDGCIFISTNAARYGMELVANYWPQLPGHLEFFAVGPTTATLLQEYGLLVHYPRRRMSSEALLALPEMAEIEGWKFLIFRGVGGRELLARGLEEKGADVDYLEIYRRERPCYNEAQLAEWLAPRPPRAVVMSSAEALQNFLAIFSAHRDALRECVLFVSSERIRDEAGDVPFAETVIMSGANDQAIVSALRAYFGKRHD